MLDEALEGTRLLLRALADAGAYHPDLNVKNVLIDGSDPSRPAWVLDVDRVQRTDATTAARRNARRLARSMRRWQERKAASITNEHIARIAALAEMA